MIEYPDFKLFRRKDNEKNMPYMLFNLTYSCFSILIEVPNDVNDVTHTDFEQVQFPYIPFYSAKEVVWDFSETELAKDFKPSIVLGFEKMTECTEKYRSS